MKTLQDFTATLAAAGCLRPRMERNYRRRDHRETLVRCWAEWRTQGKMPMKARNKEGEDILRAVCDRLRAAGFELTYESWNYSTDGGSVELWVQAKVQLAERY